MKPPEVVVKAVDKATGARPVSWQHVVAGHTHAEKWRVELRGGQRVFVKAGTNTAGAQIRREASILESVAAPYMPRLFGWADAEEWAVLVLEELSDAQWPPPYFDNGAALLETVLAVGATAPPAGLQRRPEGRPHGTYWQRIAADPEPVLAHGLFSAAWLQDAQPVLDAAESVALLAGDDFVHDDVWAGNVCYTTRGALLVDWASASIGDRRIDLAYALLSLRAEGSMPPPLDFPDEAAYAALLAGSTAFQAAQPVNPLIRHESVLRAGWLHDLGYALEWACELLPLPPLSGPRPT